LKNYIARPQYIDICIKADDDKSIVGHFRITPAAVKWADGNKKKYLSVSLDKFRDWIKSEEANAKRTGK